MCKPKIGRVDGMIMCTHKIINIPAHKLYLHMVCDSTQLIYFYVDMKIICRSLSHIFLVS